jgi:hypothetical protein
VGGVPKHWDLADIHERDILRFLRKSRERYERFFGDEVLCAVFDETQDAMLDLNRFVDTIPILASVRAPAHGDHPARDLYRLFDRRTLLLLLEYCWLSVFYEYMRASCETVPAKAVRSAQRRSAAAAAATAIFGETKEVEGYETGVADVDYSRQDPDMDAFDIQARSGVAETTKTRVAALLLAFMQITMDEKRQIDVPYREVEHGMSILRTLEKQGITDFLKNMEADERKAEFERKKLKLGRWALGLQKGIVDYDKAMYGREREAMNELFADEGWDDDGGAAYADESDLDAMQAREMLDVDDLTRRAEMDADAEADAEAYDMSDLDEDYRDEYEG